MLGYLKIQKRAQLSQLSHITRAWWKLLCRWAMVHFLQLCHNIRMQLTLRRAMSCLRYFQEFLLPLFDFPKHFENSAGVKHFQQTGGSRVASEEGPPTKQIKVLRLER